MLRQQTLARPMSLWLASSSAQETPQKNKAENKPLAWATGLPWHHAGQSKDQIKQVKSERLQFAASTRITNALKELP
jgi:hypothetical protein